MRHDDDNYSIPANFNLPGGVSDSHPYFTDDRPQRTPAKHFVVVDANGEVQNDEPMTHHQAYQFMLALREHAREAGLVLPLSVRKAAA